MKKVLVATIMALSIGAANAQDHSMNIIRAQVPVVFVADANPDPSENEPAEITLTLNNGLLPDGTVSTGYNFDLNPLISWSNLPEGSQPPAITWSVTNALPAGLVLNQNGTITGNPTEAGTTAFEVVASASSSNGRNLFTLKIKAQLVVTLQEAALPEARVGQAYSYDFAPLAQWSGLESGEEPPALVWSTDDELPQGLTLSQTGTLTGTPVQAGDASFEILAASENHTGAVKCWGSNATGILGAGAGSSSSTPVDLSIN